MSEEDKEAQQKLIENTINTKIDAKMKGIYWIIGGTMVVMLTIFVTIALPIQSNLIEAIKKLETKADADKVEAKFNKADKTYMQKWDYYTIEVDEHRVLKEAIKNPAQIDYLMGVINDNIEVKLIGKFTTRGGEK